jgi:hypothetical protein
MKCLGFGFDQKYVNELGQDFSFIQLPVTTRHLLITYQICLLTYIFC